MAKSNDWSKLSSSAKAVLTSLKKGGQGGFNYTAEDITALQGIKDIPGAMDVLQSTPELAQQVLKDPVAALAAYESAVGAGGTGGGTGDPNAVVTSSVDVSAPAPGTPADIGIPDLDAAAADAGFSKQTTTLDTMIADLTEANASMLKGEIPGDVTAATRQGSAESAMTAGLFGPNAVQLGVQQLGTTSLNIKQQGIQNATSTAGLQVQATQFAQNKREFDYTYRLNTQQLLEDMRRTELNYKQLAEQQAEYNASNNMQLISYIADLVTNSAQIQTNLAINDIDGETIASDFSALILQLDKLLVPAS